MSGAHSFTKGDVLDLRCSVFGWRGKYRLLAYTEDGLAKIENLGTSSKQHVSPERLRRSQCPQFAVWDNARR